MLKTLFIIIVCIVGLIYAFYYVLNKASQGMRDKAMAFLNALIVEDFNKAYAMTSPEFKVNVPVTDFEQYLLNGDLFEISKIERYIGDYAIGRLSGNLYPILARKDGTFLKIDLLLLKQDHEWLIHSIAVKQTIAATD
ncbi:MAG: hypothetical protein HKN88_06200 [Gammaproteobacteria bacterium]|nr:hypothetical protein [Gammaproteobacteria bacterium]NNC97648.1 hypothetical protein [Gammaproteobacteria bacterium]NNM13201.1 hypothetical protein [Gammaproteobacteria bacterium]